MMTVANYLVLLNAPLNRRYLDAAIYHRFLASGLVLFLMISFTLMVISYFISLHLILYPFR